MHNKRVENGRESHFKIQCLEWLYIDYPDSIWPVVQFAYIALKTFVRYAALVRPCIHFGVGVAQP